MIWQSRIRRALAQDGFRIRHMERRWFTKGPFADMRMPGSKFTREWLVRIVADSRDGEPRAGWVRWQRGRPWEASDRWAIRWDDVPWAGVWDGTATRTTSLPTRVFVIMLLVAIAIIVIAALAPLLALGAAQPATSRVAPQRFVCERSHMNFAWGYRYAGVFVDGTGAIYSFSTEKHHARDPNAPAGLTEGEMEAKYGPAKLVGNGADGAAAGHVSTDSGCGQGAAVQANQLCLRLRVARELLLRLRCRRGALSRSGARRERRLGVPQPRTGGENPRLVARVARAAERPALAPSTGASSR